MKQFKSVAAFLTLIVMLVATSFGLYQQYDQWRHTQVLGTTNTQPSPQSESSSPKPHPGTKDERGFEQVRVVRVIDGDTIELEDGRTVRYIGIDTPETKHPTKGIECFGKEASNRNVELVANQVVQLEKDVSETDRYGRLLRYVWVGDRQINKQLVSEGYAYASSYPPDIKYQDELRAAQQQAHKQGVGLWEMCEVRDTDQIQQAIETADIQVLGATDSDEQQTLIEENCVIKGNITGRGKLYHLPSCGSYSSTKIDQTKGEKWFCTEEEAQAAGWQKSTSCK